MPVLQTQAKPRWWQRSRRPSSSMEHLFLTHLPLIERAATATARRAGLPPQEIEDFVSSVKVKILDDDYGVLRRHRGDSSMTTFLVTVVNNLFKDHLNQRFGKFRPSQMAKRLGPTALALERLLVIERLDLDAAVEIMVRNHKVDASRDELLAMAEQLPRRQRRQFVDGSVLDDHADDTLEGSPEHRLYDSDRAQLAHRIEKAMQRALARIEPQDRLILQMSYGDGCKLSSIAQTLQLVQRSLYSRRDKCLRSIRSSLAEDGVSWQEVSEVLGWRGGEIQVLFDDDPPPEAQV